MLRGPLASPGFRGQFSGHETFPLRYGWLNKVFDAVSRGKSKRNLRLFSRDEAIADFGVGKNMVSSMKHWALAAGIIEEVDEGYKSTWLGELLMGEEGLDPYLESLGMSWKPSCFAHYVGQFMNKHQGTQKEFGCLSVASPRGSWR